MNTQTTTDAIVGQIAAAYFSNNQIAATQIAETIREIRKGLSEEPDQIEEDEEPLTIGGIPDNLYRKPNRPEIQRSVTNEHIISFIDGKPYKTLRRHLSTNGFDEVTYRQYFNLPHDYPMVAPGYSYERKRLAMKMGLGRKA